MISFSRFKGIRRRNGYLEYRRGKLVEKVIVGRLVNFNEEYS